LGRRGNSTSPRPARPFRLARGIARREAKGGTAMSTSLMTTRRFAPLFWCQFFSAFGDNFLKTALVFLILFQIGGANSEVLITLAGATLIFPFFLLSGLGGELADRY